MATDAGLRLQLATGVASHVRRFGHWGGGFWLPECAYGPGLERELADYGVRSFCVDQTGVPGFDHLQPVATGAGPVALPVDWELVELVWDGEDGYPAHGLYRNYPGPYGPRPEAVEHRGGSRTTTPRRGSWRASTRATSSAGRAERQSGRRASPASPSTPSCSATGGTRASLARGRVQRGERSGVSARHGARGNRAGGAGGAPLPESTWGRHEDFTTWDSPASPTSPSTRAGPSSGRWRRPRPTAAPRPSSARRASCSRCSRATGPSWSAATSPRLPGRADALALRRARRCAGRFDRLPSPSTPRCSPCPDLTSPATIP